ncbi:MAG TPA: hypothetical protein VFD77_05780 [Brumimicrobium sp.]|nr:hypothetical protein [Brumimicrobium sp.]
MIKHSLKDNQIHLSIDNMDFSYRIPLKKIGNTIDWKIGVKGSEGIVMKDVSIWTLKLFANNTTEENHITQFQQIVQEYSPKNTIDWEESLLAIKVQNEYNSLISANTATKNKVDEEDIISTLNDKYKLDSK